MKSNHSTGSPILSIMPTKIDSAVKSLEGVDKKCKVLFNSSKSEAEL